MRRCDAAPVSAVSASTLPSVMVATITTGDGLQRATACPSMLRQVGHWSERSIADVQPAATCRARTSVGRGSRTVTVGWRCRWFQGGAVPDPRPEPAQRVLGQVVCHLRCSAVTRCTCRYPGSPAATTVVVLSCADSRGTTHSSGAPGRYLATLHRHPHRRTTDQPADRSANIRPAGPPHAAEAPYDSCGSMVSRTAEWPEASLVTMTASRSFSDPLTARPVAADRNSCARNASGSDTPTRN